MSKGPSHYAGAYAACLNEVLRQAPTMIESWRVELFDFLNERYTSSMQNIEKRHLHEAMLALDTHQVDIRRNFLATLTDTIVGIAKRPSDEHAEEPNDFSAFTSFDELELLGDSEVQDTLDGARVLQVVAMVCEAGLAAFSARLSTAQGYAEVNPEKNTLLPRVFSTALLKAAQSIPVDNAIRSLWFTHGSAVMGKIVQALYLALNDLLIEKGVAPAPFRVKVKRESAAHGRTADADLNTSAFSAFAPLADSVNVLPTIAFPSQEQSDTQHFAKLLVDFEKTLAKRDAVVYSSSRGTAQGLLAANQIDLLAQKIAIEIRTRSDFVLKNSAITAFLTGPWSQVMAKERLTADADKTGMHKAIFSLTLGELLWSLDIRQTAAYPKHLAKLIPSLLERLEGGLLSINSAPTDSIAFFAEIGKLHQSALESGLTPVPARASTSSARRHRQTASKLDDLFEQGDLTYGSRSGLAPLNEQNAKPEKKSRSRAEPHFEQTKPFFATTPDQLPEVEAEGTNTDGVHLKLGSWIELSEENQQVRAQLTWVSRYKTLFLFTSIDGRTHSMAAPLLHYYLLQGLVKVIIQDGVLDDAVGRV